MTVSSMILICSVESAPSCERILSIALLNGQPKGREEAMSRTFLVTGEMNASSI